MKQLCQFYYPLAYSCLRINLRIYFGNIFENPTFELKSVK